MKKRPSPLKKPSIGSLLTRLALVNGSAIALAVLSIRGLMAIGHLLSVS